LIGATEADDGAGSVYVFRHVEGGGWIEEDELTGSGGVGDAFFGLSVSLSGDYAIIGAPYDDEMGNRSGAAYIFHLDGGQWTQQARIQSSDISAGDRFGWSASISGDYAIVAALYGRGPENSTGAAYVFARKDTTWTEQAKIVDSTSITSACFGYSVSIDGDYAVVAESQDDDNGTLSGSAFLYKREGAEWREVTKLLASDGMESARFGWSIFMQGDEVLVGAPVQDAGGFLTGAAYVYTDFPTSASEQEAGVFPSSLILEQNFPNPFQGATDIEFALPSSSHSLLTIHDLTGRRVRTLIDWTCEPGFHQVNWDGRDVAGQEVASGVYFCRLQTEEQAVTKKMTLLR
jgi:hypothetical protein